MSSANLVIRDLPGGITTFSVPFMRGGVVPIGGRSTAIKREDGSLFIVASTPLDEPTKLKINELSQGRVSHIVALDAVHSMYTEQYVKAFPDAKVIGVEPLIKKRPQIKWTGVYGRDADPLEGLKGFKAQYFSGFQNKDVAILHEPSKTLIEADLLFNIPAQEQLPEGKKGFLPMSLIKSFSPYTAFHRRFLWYAVSDRKQMGESARIVSGWDFQRIIPCHGAVIEGEEAKKAWNSAFDWYLKQ